MREDTESGCDGEMRSFTYYDENGVKLHFFRGYTYAVPVMQEISEILDSGKPENRL